MAILWVLEADDRAKERHYRAWELINSARGSSGDGGRRDALQDLNKDGVSLTYAPLVQAYLPYVDLAGADLAGTDLQGANLGDETGLPFGAKLQGANLQDVRNLTQEQLDAANGDDRTILPEGFIRPAHWPKAEAPEAPPAAQPDDTSKPRRRPARRGRISKSPLPPACGTAG